MKLADKGVVLAALDGIAVVVFAIVTISCPGPLTEHACHLSSPAAQVSGCEAEPGLREALLSEHREASLGTWSGSRSLHRLEAQKAACSVPAIPHQEIIKFR